MNTIPQYCQKCREKNTLGEQTCRRCGTRLMLVVFPHSLKYDTNYVPSYYEDHLLERVSSLELRLSQVVERLAATLDLLLRQTKTAHTHHLLLETLIESLNTLGAIEKDKLTKNWRERVDAELVKDNDKKRRENTLARILAGHGEAQSDLFEHLVGEGLRFFGENEEKQGLRTLERASLLSPKNVALLSFIAENLVRADKFELARDYLKKARNCAPKNVKISLLLGFIYADEGNSAEAKKILDALSGAKDAAFCLAYLNGMIAAVEERWTNALAAFKETLSAKNSPETNYLTGCVYFQLGRNKMAVRHLQKAVEEDSGYADAWYMLGVVYENAGEAEKARQAAEFAWSSKETGAQCLEFLKRKNAPTVQTALPFLKFKLLKTRFLRSGSMRLTRLFNEELFKVLN